MASVSFDLRAYLAADVDGIRKVRGRALLALLGGVSLHQKEEQGASGHRSRLFMRRRLRPRLGRVVWVRCWRELGTVLLAVFGGHQRAV